MTALTDLLPKPVGPATKPPADAVLYCTDYVNNIQFYQIGPVVWQLHGEQWSIYGLVSQWPEPLNKEHIKL